MTPEHNPNPFNNPEFRKEMSEMFDDKLSPFTNHEPRIASLERWRWYLIGIFSALIGLLKLAAMAIGK